MCMRGSFKIIPPYLFCKEQPECLLPRPAWTGLVRSSCLPQVTVTCVPVSPPLPERMLLEEGNVLESRAQGHQVSPEETQLLHSGRALAVS